jgi:hypothetical protein
MEHADGWRELFAYLSENLLKSTNVCSPFGGKGEKTLKVLRYPRVLFGVLTIPKG